MLPAVALALQQREEWCQQQQLLQCCWCEVGRITSGWLENRGNISAAISTLLIVVVSVLFVPVESLTWPAWLGFAAYCSCCVVQVVVVMVVVIAVAVAAVVVVVVVVAV